MAKRCKRCEQLKDLSEFSVSRTNKGGYSTLCKACVVLRNMEYWRTAPGRMSQIYAIQTMCSKQRKHPKPEYTRKELTEWAFAHGLDALWSAWRNSGYTKDLIPSIDRLDPTKPYSLSNIRLVTWAENNEKAYEDRKECRHVTKQNRRIEQLTLDGTHIAFFDSIASAARKTGNIRTNINGMCKGKPNVKSVGGFLWRYADQATIIKVCQEAMEEYEKE